MEARNLFETAVESWYRDNSAVALQRLRAQTPAEVKEVHWRGTTVTDGTRSGDNQIPVEAEHLLRWSRTKPEIVFKNGFAPMALADKGRDWNNLQPFNLKKYVGDFGASVAVFVSTTRYRWKDGKASTWRPTDWESGTYYEYAITGCEGGIDVNKTLPKHVFQNEGEVAFVGGILPRFIKSVTEYKDGVAKQTWENDQI